MPMKTWTQMDRFAIPESVLYWKSVKQARNGKRSQAHSNIRLALHRLDCEPVGHFTVLFMVSSCYNKVDVPTSVTCKKSTHLYLSGMGLGVATIMDL